MKRVIKILAGITLSALITVVGLYATANEHLIRALQLTYLKGETTANINDYTDFETNTIKAGEAQVWPLHPSYNNIALNEETLDLLTRSHAAAFLVIKDGQILSEQYFAPYHDRSKTNSFSMAKSMTTMLIGTAIEDGLIESFDSPVDSLVPELKGKAPEVSLAHLAAMTSGIDWDEHYYSPLSATPKLLYGYDAKSYMLERGYPQKAGSEYYYASASTQVLGMALQNALKEKSISEYFSEKFWQPLGMNDDAFWHTDTKGLELTFCCVSTNARNFAKLGQLLLQNGQWNGNQLLNAEFVQRMIKPNINNFYGHSIWNDYRDAPVFYGFFGHLGQYILVIPEHNTVVVRLGETQDEILIESKAEDAPFSPEILFYADQSIALVNKIPE